MTRLLFAVLTALWICTVQADAPDPSCALTTPPADAAVMPTHGFDYLVYPARVGADYDGCQSLWLEDGRKLATIHFKNGKPYRLDGREPRGEPYRCSYDDDGRLAEAAADGCPARIEALNVPD